MKYRANIYDNLTETMTHTIFYNTEEEARKQGIEKIERLERIRNMAIGSNRFEIDSITTMEVM